MLTPRLFTDDPARVIRGLEKKLVPQAAQAVERVALADGERRRAQRELDETLAEARRLAGRIGAHMRAGDAPAAQAAKARVAELRERERALAREKKEAEERLEALLLALPNLPYDEVPEGRSAGDNVVERSSVRPPRPGDTVAGWSDNPDNPAAREPHWELARRLRLVDFDLGVKITGAGFPVYTGQGARLQRALINFFLDEARAAGYREVMPPTVVNAASARATGQLPDKEAQMYHCPQDGLYLIPTAEVPVTNIWRGATVDEADLPLMACAYTQCFRREAGSYGRDVRGLNRLHEFAKVELVRVDTPEHSRESHRQMLAHVEGLLRKLELPWRMLRLCGGDISFTAALCYDFEVYSQGQRRWLEVSSVSNFDTYQANRLGLRLRRAATRKTETAHTLNGSALALPRVTAALLENNQTPRGIRLPRALAPYMGTDIIE